MKVRAKNTFIHNSSRVRKGTEFDYEQFYGREVPEGGLEPWLEPADTATTPEKQLEEYAGRKVVYPKSQHDYAGNEPARPADPSKAKK